MSRNLFLIATLSLLSIGTLSLPPAARAETPLTRATVQALRNQVQLIFKNRVTRAAQTADTMTPGDSLATARRSFAELRFNDSSLARIGERTLFQFVPNTRNFYLGNGTALLLIPPGQGRTNVRTPNAAAGIRGSALFVRYNEDTNTTIVGALTNSRIEVANGETSQTQTLKAGQMAVIVQNQVVQVYNFDLNTFYQTSELVKDLDLPLSNAAPSADPGIAAVQAETSQAARAQTPLTGRVSENPAFVSLTPPPGVQTIVTPSLLGTTPIPSGWELGNAQQSILPTAAQPASPDSQPAPPDSRPAAPSSPTLPNSTPAPVARTATPNPPGTSAATSSPVVSGPRPAPIVTTPVQPSLPPTPVSAPAPVPAVPTPTPLTPSPSPAAPVVTTPITSTPTPVISAPTPTPVTPTPAPIVTTPVQPSLPVTPTPVTPTPVTPTPVTPTPVTPTPVTPTPVTPTPVTPTPVGTTTAPRPAPTVVTPTPAAATVQPTVSTPAAVTQPAATSTATPASATGQ